MSLNCFITALLKGHCRNLHPHRPSMVLVVHPWGCGVAVLNHNDLLCLWGSWNLVTNVYGLAFVAFTS